MGAIDTSSLGDVGACNQALLRLSQRHNNYHQHSNNNNNNNNNNSNSNSNSNNGGNGKGGEKKKRGVVADVIAVLDRAKELSRPHGRLDMSTFKPAMTALARSGEAESVGAAASVATDMASAGHGGTWALNTVLHAASVAFSRAAEENAEAEGGVVFRGDPLLAGRVVATMERSADPAEWPNAWTYRVLTEALEGCPGVASERRNDEVDDDELEDVDAPQRKQGEVVEDAADDNKDGGPGKSNSKSGGGGGGGGQDEDDDDDDDDDRDILELSELQIAPEEVRNFDPHSDADIAEALENPEAVAKLMCVFTPWRELDVASSISVASRLNELYAERKAAGATPEAGPAAVRIAYHISLAIASRFGRREHVPAALRLIAALDEACPERSPNAVARALFVGVVARVRQGPDPGMVRRAWSMVSALEEEFGRARRAAGGAASAGGGGGGGGGSVVFQRGPGRGKGRGRDRGKSKGKGKGKGKGGGRGKGKGHGQDAEEVREQEQAETQAQGSGDADGGDDAAAEGGGGGGGDAVRGEQAEPAAGPGAAVSRIPLVLNIELYNTLLTAMAKTRGGPDLDLAAEVLARMRMHSGTYPTTLSYNLYLECLAKGSRSHDDIKTAFDVVARMESAMRRADKRCSPDRATYASLINVIAKNVEGGNDVNAAHSVLQRMKREERTWPNRVAYNTMLDVVANAGGEGGLPHLRLVFDLIDEMSSPRQLPMERDPDLFTFTAVFRAIEAFCRYQLSIPDRDLMEVLVEMDVPGLLNRVNALRAWMKKLGLRPNSYAVSSLVRCYLVLGSPDLALDAAATAPADAVREHALKPLREHFEAIGDEANVVRVAELAESKRRDRENPSNDAYAAMPADGRLPHGNNGYRGSRRGGGHHGSRRGGHRRNQRW